MHLFISNPDAARAIEFNIVRGTLIGGAMVVTNMIQIVIASMFFMDFVPYYDQITGHCQGPYKDGGYPYSETTAVALSTAAFYIMVPLTIHTILNTFVWGLAPDWLESKKKSKGITPVIEGAKKPAAARDRLQPGACRQ